MGMPPADTLPPRIREEGADLVAALKAQVECLQAQLRESHLLASVANRADLALVLTDQFRRIEWINDSFSKLTGYALNEVRGHRPGDILQCSQTDPQTIAAIGQALRSDRPIQADLINRRKDGSRYWVSLEIQPLLDEQGQAVRHLGVLRDVTFKRRADTRLMLHHAVAQLMADSQDMGDMLPNLLARLGGFLECVVGAAWEVKGKRWVGDTGLQCAHVWTTNGTRYAGLVEASYKKHYPKGDVSSLPARTWLNRQAGQITDVTASVDAQQDVSRVVLAIREGLRSVMAWPIVSNGRVTHVLEFWSPLPLHLDDELRLALHGVSAQVTQFFERKRDEMRVRQLLLEFDSLFKLSPDGFVVFNAEGIRSYGNPAFYDMTGLTREQLDGIHERQFDAILASLCAPEHPPAPTASLAGNPSGDLLHLASPQPRLIQRSVRNMLDAEQGHIGRAVYLRDVTPEKQRRRAAGAFHPSDSQ